ncbi:MAG TPA: NosD domain-containing protein, partial [bacterium]|nr:NosD domain-containing protein [bacterium]
QLANGDTDNWYEYLVKTVSANETSWIDNTIDTKSMYYYRVTAFDSHTANGRAYYNESWYSAAVACSAPYNGPVWYVNAATGSDTQNSGSQNSPFKTIGKALSGVSEGDTINIANGVYKENIVIIFNNISLIGADSVLTIINPNGDTAVNNNGITATNKNNLTIKNLHITKCYYGINFSNVDSSVIDNVTIDYCNHPNGMAVYIINDSDSNIITNCYIFGNGNGMRIYNSAGGSSDSNVIINNKFISNNSGGLGLTRACYNVITGNTFASNQDGLRLYTNSLYNQVFNNISTSNREYGMYIMSQSNYNNITANTCSLNTKSGIFLEDSSNYNRIAYNNISSNNEHGLNITYSSYNEIIGNISRLNSYNGIILSSSSHYNSVRGNSLNNNNYYGITFSTSSNNYISQNDIKENGLYQIYITGLTSADTFFNNNIKTSSVNPDSNIWNVSSSGNYLDFRYNYWNILDSASLVNTIKGAASDKIIYLPFLLNEIDTAVGADTIAPSAVSAMTYDTSVAGQIILNWTQPVFTGTAGGDGLAGYYIFRAKESDLINGDTNNWYFYKIATVNYPLLTYTDAAISLTDTYYYRIIAFDKHTTNGTEYRNESQYSPIFQAIPLRNRAPQLILPADAMIVYEDTPVFILTFTSDNIKDSDANDTIGNIALNALDTDFVKIIISNNDLTKTASFYLLSDTFGTDTIIFQITDAAGASDSKVFVLTVLNVNDTPIITSLPATTATQDIKYYYQVTATDTDNQVISYQLSNIRPNGMQISDTGSIYWTPNASQVGLNTVEVLAGDGLDTAIEIFSINVANVNDTPELTLSNNGITVLEDCQQFYIDIISSNISDSDANDTIATM